MSILNMEPDSSPPQISSVREAASELGVSERTIYRMLRSGRLKRVKTRVSVVRNVSDMQNNNVTERSSIGDNQVSKTSNMSDIMTIQALEIWKAELRQKDAQIEQL